MTDQIQAELIVTAIAKGFDQMGNAIIANTKAMKEEEAATRKASAAIAAQEAASKKLEQQQKANQKAMKDMGDGAKMAFEIIGKGLDYAAAASERLGRTDMPDALENAQQAAQRLGDSLFELPIGKINPLFQVFGDEALKSADALTILTRGLQGAADGANFMTAAWVKFQAETGQISWDEAAAQIEAMNGAVEQQAVFVDATAQRWTELAKSIGASTADASIKKWLEMREAEEGAARLSIMADVATTLAAGLGGAVSQAQGTYTQAMADSNAEIVKLRDEIANTDKNSRDYTATVAGLNDAIGIQTQKQLEAAAALELSNKQFVFQQAAASLDAQGQLTLAFNMGMIDEASYNASLRVIALTESYDENNDGIISLNEKQDQYIAGLNNIAQTADGTATPAMTNYKDTIGDAEAAMGTALTKVGNFNKAISETPDKKTFTLETVYTSSGTPPPALTQTTPIPQAPMAMAAGGSTVIPPGFPNDSAMIRVQSGEKITVQTPGQQAAQAQGNNYTFGAVNIYAQPGQDGAALFAEFNAAVSGQIRARRAAGD